MHRAKLMRLVIIDPVQSCDNGAGKVVPIQEKVMGCLVSSERSAHIAARPTICTKFSSNGFLIPWHSSYSRERKVCVARHHP
jgi:hypothetical protein